MPGFDSNTVFVQNMNFSDPLHTAFDHPGEFLVAGDIAIGTGEPITGQQIAVGQLTGAGGITITYSTPNLVIDGSGVTSSLTVHTDAADAVEAAGAISILGAGGISTSGAGSTITITGSGSSGLAWSNISASQTLVINNGYFCSGGAGLSLALPAVSAVGDTIEIGLIGSASFTVTQSAGQQMVLGNVQTTAGVGGSLASTQQGDSLRIICQTANLVWIVSAGSIGNFTMI